MKVRIRNTVIICELVGYTSVDCDIAILEDEKGVNHFISVNDITYELNPVKSAFMKVFDGKEESISQRKFINAVALVCVVVFLYYLIIAILK